MYLTRHYVFEDPALLAQQHGHKRVVKELFSTLYHATEQDSDYQEMIPKPFNEKIDVIHSQAHNHSDIDANTLRARIVADIIANMTEQQVLDLYGRVTGHSPGLVTDRIVSS